MEAEREKQVGLGLTPPDNTKNIAKKRRSITNTEIDHRHHPNQENARSIRSIRDREATLERREDGRLARKCLKKTLIELLIFRKLGTANQ